MKEIIILTVGIIIGAIVWSLYPYFQSEIPCVGT